MITAEQQHLIDSTRAWFDRPSEVAAYVAEATAGPTALEAELLRRLPAPPVDVLDIGCGAGRLTIPLAQKGYRITGVDVSERLIESATALALEQRSSATFAVVLATELPQADDSVDVALAVKQLSYLPGRDLRSAYLGEIERVLRPGGMLVLTSHLIPSLQEGLQALQHDDEHHQAALRFEQLEPLDTFSDGAGFVHWFTFEQLMDELGSSRMIIEHTVVSADRLGFGAVLRAGA